MSCSIDNKVNLQYPRLNINSKERVCVCGVCVCVCLWCVCVCVCVCVVCVCGVCVCVGCVCVCVCVCVGLLVIVCCVYTRILWSNISIFIIIIGWVVFFVRCRGGSLLCNLPYNYSINK